MSEGTLFVISAASGTGKTSLVHALVKDVVDIQISISYTTRTRRPEEKADEHYHFITQQRFDEMNEKSEFIESAEVFGQFYGTSKSDIEELLRAGKDVVLEVDWQGARILRSVMTNIVSVFIVPPSKEALRQRIIARNQDVAVLIEKRLKAAASEIGHYPEYDYLIVNDDFCRALTELKSIVIAQRCRQIMQSIRYNQLLDELVR